MAVEEQPPPWLVLASRKKQIQTEAIQSFLEKHAVPRDIATITNIASIDGLAKHIASGETTATIVAIAYCHQ